MSTKEGTLRATAKPGSSVKPGRNSKGGKSAKARTGSKPTPCLRAGRARRAPPRGVAKPGPRPKSGNMEEKLGKMEKSIRKNVKDISASIESMAPPGSPERVAAGVAAVTGGA